MRPGREKSSIRTHTVEAPEIGRGICRMEACQSGFAYRNTLHGTKGSKAYRPSFAAKNLAMRSSASLVSGRW